MQLHRRTWICYLCDASAANRVAMANHLKTSHQKASNQQELSVPMEICDRPLDAEAVTGCPFCPLELTLTKLMEHLASHMEDLALFALPRLQNDDDSMNWNEDSSDSNVSSSLPKNHAPGVFDQLVSDTWPEFLPLSSNEKIMGWDVLMQSSEMVHSEIQGKELSQEHSALLGRRTSSREGRSRQSSRESGQRSRLPTFLRSRPQSLLKWDLTQESRVSQNDRIKNSQSPNDVANHSILNEFERREGAGHLDEDERPQIPVPYTEHWEHESHNPTKGKKTRIDELKQIIDWISAVPPLETAAGKGKTKPTDDVDTRRTTMEVAAIYRQKNQLKKAENLLRRFVDSFPEGTLDPEALKAQCTLVGTLAEQGKFFEAKNIQSTVLQAYSFIFGVMVGERSFYLRETITDLAWSLKGFGRYEEAVAVWMNLWDNLEERYLVIEATTSSLEGETDLMIGNTNILIEKAAHPEVMDAATALNPSQREQQPTGSKLFSFRYRSISHSCAGFSFELPTTTRSLPVDSHGTVRNTILRFLEVIDDF